MTSTSSMVQTATAVRPMVSSAVQVTGGVDTHLDTHTVAAIDGAGRMLGSAQFPADRAGYAGLLSWLRSFGTLVLIGIEGTGAYGAGLTAFLQTEQVELVEVDRPDRKARRWQGKSDPVDAEAAARAALGRVRTGTPKRRDGRVEALRVLRVARRCAVAHRADLQRTLKMLLVTAPEQLRAALRDLPTRQLLQTCAALRPDPDQVDDPTTAAKVALRSLAHQHRQLTTEIGELDALIAPLVKRINPELLATAGIGADVAGQLLVTAGENTDRLRSEAAFAMLCGAAPLPASSGKTTRHRLNRGGDRQANCALWRIVITRMATDPRTRAYVRRRTAEGLSKTEIIRCLKRYIAREVHALLTANDLDEP
jgi:transposase